MIEQEDMFKLFDVITLRETKDNLIFELSDAVHLSLVIAEAPYYSRLYLFVKGKEVDNVSIAPSKVAQIKQYFNQIDTTKTLNQSFLLKLNELGLNNFYDALRVIDDSLLWNSTDSIKIM